MNSRFWASRAGRRRRRLADDSGGAMAVSFAIIAPILLAVTFGVFEFTMVTFDYHRGGEATRRGARRAAIDAPVPSLDSLADGAPILCTHDGSAVNCGGAAILSAATFDAVVAEIQALLPSAGPRNVTIRYSFSGIGDADTPGGILPLVTVNLVALKHSLAFVGTLPGVPADITFPAFSTTTLAGGAPASS